MSLAGAIAMHYYRLYFMDVAGHISDVNEGFFADDAAALEEALRLDGAPLIEIWRHDRKVAEVRPQRARARPD